MTSPLIGIVCMGISCFGPNGQELKRVNAEDRGVQHQVALFQGKYVIHYDATEEAYKQCPLKENDVALESIRDRMKKRKKK